MVSQNSGYAGKGLPAAVAQNYSTTDLELCSLAVNIVSFVHHIKKVDLDAIIDHLALTHIIKSKAELAINKFKILLKFIFIQTILYQR